MTLAAPSTPPNIITDYDGWCAWDNRRDAAFLANCPLARGTTYYFSTSGDDSNDGLSESTPKLTITKLNALEAASSGGLRFRLNCGDMWRGTVGITNTKPDTTYDSYGSGAEPFLNFYSLRYTSGWTADTGAYRRDEASDVALLRLESAREDVGSWPIELSTALAVQGTPNSFAYVAGVLWVNLGATDPNTVVIEAAISGTDSGIELTRDGARCHGLRSDGAGAHRTATAGTQKHPFKTTTTGSDAALVTNCVGYGSHTHIFAHYSSSGGRARYKNCVGGGTRQAVSVAGTSVFNAFATTASGVEVAFRKCIATYGQLRNYNWNYATDKVEGAAFLSHTGGADFALLVIRDCSAPTSTQGNQTLTHISNMPAIADEWDVAQARGFVVDCDFAQPVENHIPNFCWMGSNTVYYGVTISGKPAISGVSAMDAQTARRTHCYWINSLFDLDMTYAGATGGYYAMWNGSSGTAGVRLLHTDVLRKNVTRTGVNGSGDFDVSTGTIGAGVATNSKALNSILQSVNSSGSSTAYMGFSNQSANLKNNAYRNMVLGATWEGGYNADAGKVTLSSDYAFGTSHAQLLAAGTTDIMAQRDINGKLRTAATPDIGATDYSSPAASIDIRRSRCRVGVGIGIGI